MLSSTTGNVEVCSLMALSAVYFTVIRVGQRGRKGVVADSVFSSEFSACSCAIRFGECLIKFGALVRTVAKAGDRRSKGALR